MFTAVKLALIVANSNNMHMQRTRDASTDTLAGLRLPASRWSRGFDWLRGTPTGLVALALVVGAGAGLGAVAFRYLILWFTRLFSGHDDYSSAGHAVNHWVPWLGIFFVLAAPVVGGAVYGPVV